MKASKIHQHIDSDGKPCLTIQLEYPMTEYYELKEHTEKGKFLEVEIKKFRKKRSLDANAYLFILCDKLAKALNSTKEEVYQEAIRKVGLFEYVAIKNNAVESFLKHWNSMGLGNYAEATEKAKKDGYTVIITYFGSSSYNSKDFSRVLDYVIEECKTQNIETLSENEIKRLVALIN